MVYKNIGVQKLLVKAVKQQKQRVMLVVCLLYYSCKRINTHFYEVAIPRWVKI